jgi:hypothetical protein
MDARDPNTGNKDTTETNLVIGETPVLPVPVDEGEQSNTSSSDEASFDTDVSDAAVGHSEDEPHAGMPGDGAGRRDEIGGKSGVYPFTDAPPDLDAPVRTGAEFGQGDRGPEGYYDAGTSEGSPAGTAQELLEDEDTE